MQALESVRQTRKKIKQNEIGTNMFQFLKYTKTWENFELLC